MLRAMKEIMQSYPNFKSVTIHARSDGAGRQISGNIPESSSSK